MRGREQEKCSGPLSAKLSFFFFFFVFCNHTLLAASALRMSMWGLDNIIAGSSGTELPIDSTTLTVTLILAANWMCFMGNTLVDSVLELRHSTLLYGRLESCNCKKRKKGDFISNWNGSSSAKKRKRKSILPCIYCVLPLQLSAALHTRLYGSSIETQVESWELSS